MRKEQDAATRTPAEDLARVHELDEEIVDAFRHLTVRIPVDGKLNPVPPQHWTRFERERMEEALEGTLEVFQTNFRERRALCVKLGIGKWNHTDDVLRPRNPFAR